MRFERQPRVFKDGRESSPVLITTEVSLLPEKQREITQRSPLTSHQAKESLPTRYEITADGCSASTDKRSAKKAFKDFLFFFQFAGAVCSCVNLFTIPLRNRFFNPLVSQPQSWLSLWESKLIIRKYKAKSANSFLPNN